MTGYEVTKRAIEFGVPAHLPICLNAYEPDFTGDVVFVFLDSPCNWKLKEYDPWRTKKWNIPS